MRFQAGGVADAQRQKHLTLDFRIVRDSVTGEEGTVGGVRIRAVLQKFGR